MKRYSALFLVLLMLCSLATPAAAADTTSAQTVTTQIIDLGDGLTVTEELVVNDSARASSRSSTKTHTFRDGTTVIAEIAITGVFRYDGTTVSVTSKLVSKKNTYDGWSFSQSSFTSSGGTITLTGKLKKPLNASVNVNMSLTCDKNGNIS